MEGGGSLGNQDSLSAIRFQQQLPGLGLAACPPLHLPQPGFTAWVSEGRAEGRRGSTWETPAPFLSPDLQEHPEETDAYNSALRPQDEGLAQPLTQPGLALPQASVRLHRGLLVAGRPGQEALASQLPGLGVLRREGVG